MVPPPISLKIDIFIQDRPIKITGCILPGACPHGEKKVCQDNYIYLFHHNLILCALFDGHGPVGEEISSYCVNFTNTYFSVNILGFVNSPKEALINLLEECDKTLRSTSSIDHTLSGSTAVAILLTSKDIHSASLGDSRGILGTLAEDFFPSHPPKNKFCRKFNATRALKSTLLTIDQKPNHNEEYSRIIQAGGTVERFRDIMGNSFGPVRVWKPDCDVPGLAMSRSIGDGIGKTIGVISTPIYHHFSLYPDSDQYIVIASDGI